MTDTPSTNPPLTEQTTAEPDVDARLEWGTFAPWVLATGVAFLSLLALVFVLSNILPSPGYPSPFQDDIQLDRFFADNRAEVRGQSLALMLAGIALLTLTASLVAALTSSVRDLRSLIMRWRCGNGGTWAGPPLR